MRVASVSIVYGPAWYPLLAASASALGLSTSIPPPAMSPVQMPKGGPKVSCVTPIVEPSLMTCAGYTPEPPDDRLRITTLYYRDLL
ncbi:uncharacterized protein TrAFT101_001546 [Trichoderma asperellum]|uniref:uncharacterized protein n=1 Tax=Trichoderma asperellum TaxID=101201 RepID=UPI00332D2916|nr:hypothetical protein TrAFT101_001546 [Trichoderma asperellum]